MSKFYWRVMGALVFVFLFTGCDNSETGTEMALDNSPANAVTGANAFIDITSAVDLANVDAGGATFVDFNQDGRMDVVINGKLYQRNIDNEKFSLLYGGLGGKASIFADFDNDGDLDVFVGKGWSGSNKLLMNKGVSSSGSPVMQNVTMDAGIDANVVYGAVAWGDFDNDGDLDLFLGGFEDHYDTMVPEPDFLYRNDGLNASGIPVFTNVTQSVGMSVSSNRAATAASWADYDDDGDLDLYVANYRMKANFLWQNQLKETGQSVFIDVASTKGVAESSRHSTSIDWIDFDNDMDLDLFVTNLTHSSRSYASSLFRNDSGNFTEITSSSGLNAVYSSLGGSGFHDIGATFTDHDNDGDLDAYITGSAQGGTAIGSAKYFGLFLTNTNGVLTNSGYSSMEIVDSWGTASADYDNSGFPDIIVGSGNWSAISSFDPGDIKLKLMKNQLFQDAVIKNNGWVKVKLVGNPGNKMGIGAKITLHLNNGKTVTRLVAANSKAEGFAVEPIVQHFGIGSASVNSGEITWSGGRTVHYLGKRFSKNSIATIYEKPHDVDAWYATDGCPRLDVRIPIINFGQSPHWNNIGVFTANRTYIGRMSSYHVLNNICNLYYPGSLQWPGSTYRYHGTKTEFRQRGLPQEIRFRFIDSAGNPYSDYSNVVDLGPLPESLPAPPPECIPCPPNQVCIDQDVCNETM
ncbi:MAG: CRTAC1 family protein [Deltaproteobacteria bacterium]|nr:CRTAC1 family protein [Deltaproteobacteria bacterium]